MADFFDDLVFPESISLHAFGGKVTRRTRRVTLENGVEQRISLWGTSLDTYDAGMVPRSWKQWALIRSIFEVCSGSAVGFKLLDRTDYTADENEGAFMSVGGSSTVFAFQKRFYYGTRAAYRGVPKPRSSPAPAIWKTSSAGVRSRIASGYTIDFVEGRITFSAGVLSAGDVPSWTGQFFKAVHFDTDELDWRTVDRNARDGLLIEGPSVPIAELRWKGMPYRVPDTYTAIVITPAPPRPAVIVLTDNVASDMINLNEGETQDYSIAYPANTSDVIATAVAAAFATSGNLTMYMNATAIPSPPSSSSRSSVNQSATAGTSLDLITTTAAGTAILRAVGGTGGFIGLQFKMHPIAIPAPPPAPSTATFNPANLETGTLSNGNKTLTTDAVAGASARARGIGSIKRVNTASPFTAEAGYCAEFTVGPNLVNEMQIGIQQQLASFSAVGTFLVYFSKTGQYSINFSVQGTATAWAAGDKIGVVVYGVTSGGGYVAFFRNGTLVAKGQINTSYVSPPFCFAVRLATTTSTPGTMTVEGSTAAQTYGATYKALRDAAVSGMPDSGDWPGSNVQEMLATTATMVVPFSGGTTPSVGVGKSPYTISVNGRLAAPITVTPQSTNGADTWSPTSATLSDTTRSASFTYTAASAGSRTVSCTNTGSLTNAGATTVTAS